MEKEKGMHCLPFHPIPGLGLSLPQYIYKDAVRNGPGRKHTGWCPVTGRMLRGSTLSQTYVYKDKHEKK